MLTAHHYPRFHVRPSTGYVNDPNGPIRVGDRWHLYFQYTRDTERRGPVLWGHATSQDLAHWQVHDPAIEPAPDRVDRDGCWSGNTIATESGIAAFYSGYRRDHPYQSVLMAVSTDEGMTFTGGRQVVTDPDDAEGIAEFRDPFVFREGDGYMMLVGAGSRAGLPSVRLYTSADLTAWKYHATLADAALADAANGDAGQTPSGHIWECPQLLSFGDRDALLVSTLDASGISASVYALTGTRQADRLVLPRVHRFDHGPNFYAASVLREHRDGPLVWGWVTEGRAEDWAIADGWSGVVSLPRVAFLAGDGTVGMRPAPSLEILRGTPLPTGRSSGRGLTFSDVPAQYELEVALAASRSGLDVPFRLTLHTPHDEHFDIIVDRMAGRIALDRDQASTDKRAHGGRFTFDEPTAKQGGPVTLRWFVDGSISELFTGSGSAATTRLYPTGAPPWRVSLSGLGPKDHARLWPYDAEHAVVPAV